MGPNPEGSRLQFEMCVSTEFSSHSGIHLSICCVPWAYPAWCWLKHRLLSFRPQHPQVSRETQISMLNCVKKTDSYKMQFKKQKHHREAMPTQLSSYSRGLLWFPSPRGHFYSGRICLTVIYILPEVMRGTVRAGETAMSPGRWLPSGLRLACIVQRVDVEDLVVFGSHLLWHLLSRVSTWWLLQQ